MKFLKPIVILFLLFSTVLSGGCGHTKEDQERIIRYLERIHIQLSRMRVIIAGL